MALFFDLTASLVSFLNYVKYDAWFHVENQQYLKWTNAFCIPQHSDASPHLGCDHIFTNSGDDHTTVLTTKNVIEEVVDYIGHYDVGYIKQKRCVLGSFPKNKWQKVDCNRDHASKCVQSDSYNHSPRIINRPFKYTFHLKMSTMEIIL